jgi:hypothetical protein
MQHACLRTITFISGTVPKIHRGRFGWLLFAGNFTPFEACIRVNQVTLCHKFISVKQGVACNDGDNFATGDSSDQRDDFDG